MLKKGGFLTRDSRMVERKKYGRAKARRSLPVLEALIRLGYACDGAGLRPALFALQPPELTLRRVKSISIR